MANLETNYLGLKLKSPVIMASSRLSARVENALKAEKAGAGAVVLRSLFEEQILVELAQSEPEMLGDIHPEALDYYSSMMKDYKISSYLDLIRATKRELTIPVFASLHCIHSGQWVQYAKKLEDAGADAIELNLYIQPHNVSQTADDIENQYYEIIENVKNVVKAPVAVKIPPYLTNFYNIVSSLEKRGASGVVMFNRFFRYDIDIERKAMIPGNLFSSPEEISLSMNWIARVFGKTKMDISASTGVHDSAAVVKQILSGASTVQVASVLYQKNIEVIGELLGGLKEWMERHGYDNLEQFRGSMSKMKSKAPIEYEREQFIKKDMEI